MLEDLRKFVNEVNSTNKSSLKLDILEKYSKNEFIKRVLFYTYNPYYQFFVTSGNLKKVGMSKGLYSDLFQLLDDLRERNITGHAAIAAVNGFIEDHCKGYEDLIYLIIDKDLKCRISDSSINKVIPNLIPTFDVALGASFDINSPPNFTNEEWYASRKLDGIRVLTIIKEPGDSDYIKFYSRAGNEFTQFKLIHDTLINQGLRNVVLDGEMCIMNGDLEDFKAISSEVKRKDFTIQNPRYLLFDFLTLEEFNNKTSKRNLLERLNQLSLNTTIPNLPYFKILQQIKVQDLAHYNALYNIAVDKGYEGLILRKNTVYEGKRGKNILKCKPFYDAEYTVESIGTGAFRVIDEDTKLEREEHMLTQVYIKHKGNTVSVGSGFSIAERRHFYKFPDDIIGKVITVQYFEESEDSNGNPSLRMPTLKVIHGTKRTI